MFGFDEDNLRDRLQQLGPRASLLFAACCAQRLIHIHRIFVIDSREGDPTLLERAMDVVWAQLTCIRASVSTQQLVEQLVTQIPDDDRSRWSQILAFEDDALAAVVFCLRCSQSGDTGEALWAARRLYDTVDLFVANRISNEVGSPPTEIEIIRDPLMQRELSRQHRDLSEIELAGQDISADFSRAFRVRASREQAIEPDGLSEILAKWDRDD